MTITQRTQSRSINVFTSSICLFILAFVFDFKGDVGGGGSSTQALMLGLAIFAALTGAWAAFRQRVSIRMPRDRGLRAIQWWAAMIYISALVALHRGVPNYTYLTTVLPYVLVLMGMILTKTYLQRGYSAVTLLNWVYLTGLFSTVFTFGYGLATSGVSLDAIRYQILSPAVPIVLGYSVYHYMFGRRSPLIYVGLVLSVMLIALSVTRSFLFTLAAVLVASVQLTGLYQRIQYGRIMRIVLTSSLALGFAYFAVETMRPDFFSDWQDRITASSNNNNSDPTLYTRVAEASWQWQDLNRSWDRLVFGEGFGAAFGWDDTYATTIGEAVTMDQYLPQYTASGHVTFVYSLFAAGLLFGWLIPGTVIFALVQAWRTLRLRASSPRAAETTSIVVVLLLAIFTQMFTSNPFGPRLSGVFLGVLVGVALFIRDYGLETTDPEPLQIEPKIALRRVGISAE